MEPDAQAGSPPHPCYRHETPVLSKPIEVVHLSEELVVLDKPCSLPVSPTTPSKAEQSDQTPLGLTTPLLDLFG